MCETIRAVPEDSATAPSHFRVLAFHHLWPAVPGTFHYHAESERGAAAPLARLTTPLPQRLPSITRKRFGLFPFRSPLLRECFFFLEVLRCFSSLGALHAPYEFRCG